MTISPVRVNLMALPTRLIRHCRRRCGSPTTRSGTCGCTCTTSSRLLRGGLERHDAADVLDVAAQIEFDGLDVELAGFDLGEVENVVDDDQQRIGAAANRFGVVALGAIERRCRAADPVMPMMPFIGRADLMADVGEELALGAIGGSRRPAWRASALRVPRVPRSRPAANPTVAAADRRHRVRRVARARYQR